MFDNKDTSILFCLVGPYNLSGQDQASDCNVLPPVVDFLYEICLVVDVTAPPKILVLAVEGSEQSGFRAMCQVQGSPLPDVQWLGPDDLLEGHLISPLAQDSVPQYHTVSQLRHVEPDKQYICSASNPLGREQSTLYVVAPRAPGALTGAPPPLLLLLSVSLGAKVLFLVGMGVWVLQGVNFWWKEAAGK